ncbi:MAG: Octaprenyl-diphosphate synthase [Deltaproteobacteria bacterium ADurb.Bin510]|nr:MAG: Octaprenyl-diphosphate synthase [Deltaproteobacteria bacterium ADurb.Bin510]
MNAEFDAGLKAITQSSARLTGEIGEYIFDAGGKRMRPQMVMRMAESLGLAAETVMPLAYTVELLHTASLLHDDVVDEAAVRRSRPTVNNVYGERPALLAGDYMFASGLDLICKLGQPAIMLDLIETIKSMTEGELRELEQANQFHADLSIYTDIIYLKTGRLFEFCTWAPGVLAGLDEAKLTALRDYGRLIGLAFQIVDDIVDVTPGDATDKDAFNDVVEGKSTMPLMCLFQVKPELMEQMAGIVAADERRQLVRDNLTKDMLEGSRYQAQMFVNTANFVMEAQGLLTDELRAIGDTIIAQLNGRF